ncbi:hypothetical protein ACRE_058060 [Hapsidospora chrysogenum ATCC 11550]|uniref:Uncharacterized protein n=1 Tax=Hapsidospora chrysogenum (strain ATCC 11550 / CBS 779.69 / DSM 880 / IAM 14645 / JCM 23072 / IMI 49137) TaxID=857340 RepID=A0A086T253_HAPC1|nr:hypothetical protein ACRE_058060 [Hapsidospora chrysogenum ATCC 11550]
MVQFSPSVCWCLLGIATLAGAKPPRVLPAGEQLGPPEQLNALTKISDTNDESMSGEIVGDAAWRHRRQRTRPLAPPLWISGEEVGA